MADLGKSTVPASEPLVTNPVPVVDAPVDASVPTTTAPAVISAENKTEEITPAVGETAATDAKVDDTKVTAPAKEVEPVSSGVLGYKAPGLVKSLIFSKKYFWVGDEAVSTSSLNSYLRGEKADVAHPTAAWSSQTGKGLLYFVKHVDDKAHPAGIINLSEVSDLQKDGADQISLKLHGHKHAFQAKTSAERDGWYLTLEREVTEAKASAEGIKSSEGYTEELKKLSAPVGPVAAVASSSTRKDDATPKKSTDLAGAADTTEPARAGSSSSDEEKKAKKSKSKSRSQSRGKRTSIFGSLLPKKEEKKDEKVEEQKIAEESKTEPETTSAAAGAPVVATSVADPAVAASSAPATEAPVAPAAPVVAAADKPVTETAATEPAVDSTTATETEKPKTAKRQSFFGALVDKVRSPTTEKKESDVVPAKASEPTTATDAPVVEPTPVAATTTEATPVTATETPAVTETKAAEELKAEEAKATVSPSKEKKDFSFGKFFGSKEKAKTPVAEKTTTDEAPKIEEGAPKIATTDALENPATTVAATEPAAEQVKAEETTAAPATEPKDKRRTSFFGSLTSGTKKEKKTEGDVSADEKHPSKLSGLFRNPSKAVKGKKDNKENVAPGAADETVEAKEDVPPVPAKDTTAAPATTTTPQVIGDVVPEAVHTGSAQPANPAVQATA